MERPFKDTKGLASYLEEDIKKIKKTTKETDWEKIGQDYKKKFLEDQKKVGNAVIMYMRPLPLEYFFNLMGWELFTYLYEENSDIISTWIKAMNDRSIIWIHSVADKNLSPVALIYCDIASKTNIFFSPDFLRKEHFPGVKSLTDAWHEYGIKVIYHSEGNIWKIMDDLVSCAIDGINPLEETSNMGPAKIRSKYPKLVLWGGIDCNQLLPYGSVDEVRATVKKIIYDCGRKGLIIGSSGGVHPACKLENVKAMIEAVKEFSRYD